MTAWADLPGFTPGLICMVGGFGARNRVFVVCRFLGLGCRALGGGGGGWRFSWFRLVWFERGGGGEASAKP